MKSLLVFTPKKFCHEEPGRMYGSVLYENEKKIYKFYILGLTKSVENISQLGNDLVPIGYFYAKKSKEEFWEKKLSNWIDLYLASQKISNIEYGLKYIMLKNQKIAPEISCLAVVILYDENHLLKAELYFDKTPINYYSDLRAILKKEYLKKSHNKLQTDVVSRVQKSIFTFLVLFFLYPMIWLCKVTNFLNPILKYSSLGLHSAAWFQNAKWTFSELFQNKKCTLKTVNYLIAVCIDITLGFLLIKLLLHFLGDSSPSDILLLHAEKVVESLKGLVNWLMGSPAGLKLNPPFNNILGKFFLYHIHLWWAFLVVSKPLMELAFKVLLYIGTFGVTFQISIVADLLALVSFHTYCIYVYAARLFNIQVRGLTALFRLFLGKKKNPLRKRVDSCRYQPDQLFVGTLLFTILLFLMPTTWVYYIVFTILRLIMIGLGGLLTRLKFYLQIMPIYAFFRWLFQYVDTSGSIGIKLLNRQIKGPLILETKSIMSPWSETWMKTIPDTIRIHPPIEWSKIVRNVFWGQLLYPF